MTKPLWTFRAFVTDAGNRVVQDWYWNELHIDERDLIRDRINYLKDVERLHWKRPSFDALSDELNEIRRDTKNGTIRIYGYFPDKRYHFVFLLAGYKHVDNDKRAKRLALSRLSQLRQGIGDTHEFDFEEESLTEGS